VDQSLEDGEFTPRPSSPRSLLVIEGRRPSPGGERRRQSPATPCGGASDLCQLLRRSSQPVLSQVMSACSMRSYANQGQPPDRVSALRGAHCCDVAAGVGGPHRRAAQPTWPRGQRGGADQGEPHGLRVEGWRKMQTASGPDAARALVTLPFRGQRPTRSVVSSCLSPPPHAAQRRSSDSRWRRGETRHRRDHALRKESRSSQTSRVDVLHVASLEAPPSDVRG
jgi:hypothetical protein